MHHILRLTFEFCVNNTCFAYYYYTYTIYIQYALLHAHTLMQAWRPCLYIKIIYYIF